MKTPFPMTTTRPDSSYSLIIVVAVSGLPEYCSIFHFPPWHRHSSFESILLFLHREDLKSSWPTRLNQCKQRENCECCTVSNLLWGHNLKVSVSMSKLISISVFLPQDGSEKRSQTSLEPVQLLSGSAISSALWQDYLQLPTLWLLSVSFLFCTPGKKYHS